MAKGNGERPAKRGTKDSLLDELQDSLNRPAPPKEAVPVAVPVVSEESIGPVVEPAPSGGAPKNEEEIRPVVAEVKRKTKDSRPRVKESFDPNKNYLHDVEEAYLELANNLRKIGVNPESLSPEVWKSANAVLGKAKKFSADFEESLPGELKRSTAAEEMYKAKSALTGGRISKRIEEAAQKYREEHGSMAQEPAAQDAGIDISGVATVQNAIEENRRRAEAELNPVAQLSEASTEAVAEPAQTEEEVDAMRKERKPISRDKLESFVREKLGKEAEITDLTISETPEGLHIRAELQHGMAGKIDLVGILANDGNTIGVQGLKVTAESFEGRVRSKIGEALSGIGNEMKTYFERQHGRRISSIQVGESGLVAELEPPSIVAEPELGPGAEQQDDADTQQEGTPKENRSRFLEVMARAKEKFGWYSSSEEHLTRRREELDVQAEKIIGGEKLFRKMGEAYNKMGWKSKLAIGIGLGIGAGVSAAAVSMPGIIAFTLGVTAQRAAGLATMFLKYEKEAYLDLSPRVKDEPRWLKEKAMGKAIVYTAAMTGAMMLLSEGVKEGVDYARQHQWGETVQNWLGNMRGYKTTGEIPTVPPSEIPLQAPAGTAVAPPTPEAPVAPMATPEVPQPAVVSNAGAAISRPVTETVLSPEPKVSFEMPKHADFSIHEDDTTISPYDVAPTDNSGETDDALLEEEAEEETVAVAAPAEVETPTYHPETTSSPVVPVEGAAEGIVPPDTSPAALEDQGMNPDNIVVPGPESIPSHAEAPVPAAPEPLQDLTRDQDLAEAPATSETLPPAPTIEHMEEFINKNKLPIDPLQGHVFQDPSGAMLAYGNDFDARFNAAQEYVKANHDAVVWVQAEKPVFYENEWRPWVFQVKYSGFGPFGSVQAIMPTGLPEVSHIGAIKPDTFIKQLDK
jgi:hypothetical protein